MEIASSGEDEERAMTRICFIRRELCQHEVVDQVEEDQEADEAGDSVRRAVVVAPVAQKGFESILAIARRLPHLPRQAFPEQAEREQTLKIQIPLLIIDPG